MNVVLQQTEGNDATAAIFTICTFSWNTDKEVLWAEGKSKPQNIISARVQKPRKASVRGVWEGEEMFQPGWTAGFRDGQQHWFDISTSLFPVLIHSLSSVTRKCFNAEVVSGGHNWVRSLSPDMDAKLALHLTSPSPASVEQTPSWTRKGTVKQKASPYQTCPALKPTKRI